MACLPGWSDEPSFCSIPICDFHGLTCKNGNCTAPNVCTCELGWSGATCSNCIPLPGCQNGYCTEPLECICQDGWDGMFCDKRKWKSSFEFLLMIMYNLYLQPFAMVVCMVVAVLRGFADVIPDGLEKTAINV